MPPQKTLIIGAGLAGLTCAKTLHEAGAPVALLEASDGVGGRARTDLVDGFRIDRGFQVLATAYPEARRQLDYARLDLRAFEPGALVRFEGKFHRLSDPRRRPDRVLETAASPLATLGDKLRTAMLVGKLDRVAAAETTTEQALAQLGFSERIIERFWRPFLSGVFLERGLVTSSRVFAFVTRMFATGDTAVPAAGMGAIAEQLAATLPADAIRLNTAVDSLTGGERPAVVTAAGESLAADAIVIATDEHAARRLLGQPEPVGWRSVRTLSFVAERSPLGEPILVLNGDGSRAAPAGPINSIAVMSDVAPGYAPDGQALISVSVLAGDDGEPLGDADAVRSQLAEWFGAVASEWRLIDERDIRHALPDQRQPTDKKTSPECPPDVQLAGDWVSDDGVGGASIAASINGAMRSGRKAAERLLAGDS